MQNCIWILRIAILHVFISVRLPWWRRAVSALAAVANDQIWASKVLAIGYNTNVPPGTSGILMSYKKIDPILQQWAKANGLHIYKEYQEGEVRSAERRSGPRSGWQIWVDKPNQDGLIGVHVWDFTKAKRGGRRLDFLVSSIDLREYLNSALTIAKGWE